MRLERLTLSPYGRFEDRTLAFRHDAPLHVVLGPNEAGKTTALSAIGDFLFGFPLRTDHGWRFDMTALRVGGALRFADGSLLEARRRKGRGNTLVDGDDKPLSDARLLAALGAVDRDTFESEFGLTARALRDGGEALLRAGGALAETVAAGSANLSVLVRLRDRLGAEASELFTPRRSAGKLFYVALDAYETADRKLRDAVVTADALKAADQKRADALSEEHRLREDFEAAGHTLARLERASRTHATLAKLASLTREREAFSDLAEIDASALQTAQQALEDDRVLQAELARIDAEATAESVEIEALVVEDALVAAGAEIDGLREKLGAVRKAADDLPRRIEARAQAVGQLDDIARRLGLADHEALLARPPSDAELALARRAIEARRDASRGLEEAKARLGRAMRAREELDEIRDDAKLADPEPLRRQLDAIGERLADAEALRRERAALEAETRALAEEALRLEPPVGDLDQLARSAFPGAADIAPFVQRYDEQTKARQLAEREAEKAQRELAAAQSGLAALERGAAGATRADWLAARERRERGLDRLAAALESGAVARRDALADARALVAAADAIGDAVLADSERAARLEAGREALAARREALDQIETEVRRRVARLEAESEQWRSLWARSGVTPHAPAKMSRWLDRVEALLLRRSQLAARRAEAEMLADRLREAETSLGHWFEATGRAAPIGFEMGYRAARDDLAARQRAWDAAQKAQEACASAARAVAEAGREVEARETEFAEVEKGWPQAMRGLQLVEAASAVEAEAALAAWGAAPLPRQNMARETRSIQGIERDLEDFEAGVRKIVAAVAPDLQGGAAEPSLSRLVDRLEDQRAAAVKRAQLEKSAEQRRVRRRREQARRQALAPQLDAGREHFGAEDDSALGVALERCEARRRDDSERVRLSKQLAEVGDGHGEGELRAEQDGVDIALLADEIAAAKARRATLVDAMATAARAVRDAEAEHEILARGRDAAGAARARMEARGELLDVAERWALRQAAAKLATRTIERHRAAVQDPLIERASALFNIATGESFSGLAMDYDDADRPVLVAGRADGARVRLEHLSEGARDQLFLSLRLALLEGRAGEPLPFIGDDILASFDDQRTRLTLQLFANLAGGQQAILLTHHNHVADIASSAGADVVELA